MKKARSVLCFVLSALLMLSLCSMVSAEEVSASKWEATQKVVVSRQQMLVKK